MTGCCRCAVGPVTVGALFELLAVGWRPRLTRPVLLRVHATSGGNPLYALELARALARLEIVPRPGVPLPVPTSLDGLVAERVASVPAEILQIAAGTAASWRFTDAGLDPGAWSERCSPGSSPSDEPLVLGDPRVVRAAHPLVGAAAYAALPPTARRALHQRLSAGADDPLERARHAALAAVSADPEVAWALDAGVAAALAGGAPDIAVELSRLALQHTEADADRGRAARPPGRRAGPGGRQPGSGGGPAAGDRADPRRAAAGPPGDPARRDGDRSDRLGWRGG